MVNHALIADVLSMPVILILPEVAAIYRISESKLRHQLQAGTFRPKPWDTYPYRWRREDVIAHLHRRPATIPRKRPHGRPHLVKSGT